MATAEQNFDSLIQHIDGLDADCIETDIEPILGDAGERGALGAIVARHQVDPGDPGDPTLRVLESVNGAIERVTSPKVKAALGGKAIESVTTVFKDGFRPGTYESARALIDWTGHIADLIEDLEKKADKLCWISEATTKMDVSGMNPEDTLALFLHAGTYLDRAAEAARGIDNPFARAYDLGLIASQAGDNIVKAAEVGVEVSESERLTYTDHMYKQPHEFYREALAACRQNVDPAEDYSAREGVLKSMLTVAAKIREVSPQLHDVLVMTATKQIGQILAETNDGALATLDVGQQASYMVGLGKDLTKVVGEQHHNLGSVPYTRRNARSLEQLEEQIIALFRLGRDKVRDPKSTRRDGYNHLRAGVSSSSEPSSQALEAAQLWAGQDFPKIKELAAIAFDLAVAEERDSGIDHIVRKVISRIDELSEQLSAEKAFELYLQLHEAQSAREGQDLASHLLQQNAVNWARYVRRHPGRFPKPESAAGQSFIKFAIEAAYWDEDVKAIGETYDDPGIKSIVAQRLEDMKIKAAKKKQPRSQTERLARQLISNL